MTDKFIPKLYQMLEDANLSQIITWSEEGDAVMIWSEENLGRILPRYGFKTNNFSAIQRQLNYYGFKKTTQGKNPTVYMHEHFYRGSTNLLEIRKRTAVKESSKAVQVPVGPTRRVTRSATKSASWPSSPNSVPVSQMTEIVFDSTAENIPLSPALLPLENISLPPVVDSSSSVSISEPLSQENFEIQRLSDENRMLKEEMRRFREQQEQTQMLMREMLAQIQQNREETNILKNLVNTLMMNSQVAPVPFSVPYSVPFSPSSSVPVSPVSSSSVQDIPSSIALQGEPISDQEATQLLEEIFSQSTQELSTQEWNLEEIRFDLIPQN
jgi:hypothetical protein